MDNSLEPDENSTPNVYINYSSFAARIAQRFLEDAEEVIASFPGKERIAITDHFISIVDCFNKARTDHSAHILAEYNAGEEALIQKYKKMLRLYYEKAFGDYMNLDYVLFTRNIIPEEEYQLLIQDVARTKEEALLRKEIPPLNLRGGSIFHQVAFNRLRAIQRELHLEQEPELESQDSGQKPSPTSLGDKVDMLSDEEKVVIEYYLMRKGGMRLITGDAAKQQRMIASITGIHAAVVKDYFPSLSKPLSDRQIQARRNIIPFFEKHGAPEIAEEIKRDIELAIQESLD